MGNTLDMGNLNKIITMTWEIPSQLHIRYGKYQKLIVLKDELT